MFNIETYLSKLLDSVKSRFHERLLYVGLQGSYLRGEATENSDIDIMIVIDKLSVTDLDDYRAIVQSLEFYDKSCGFICSKTDLENWNPLEICHLLHSTKDYYGELKSLIPAYSKQDICNFVKLSINNMYHELCHRYIHGGIEMSTTHLPYTYRGIFFILQNLYYLNCGNFVGTKAELLPLLDGKNYEVLKCAMDLQAGMLRDFSESFELLFSWCQETLQTI